MVYQHRCLSYTSRKLTLKPTKIQAGSVVGLSEAWLVNECIASLLFVPPGLVNKWAFHPFVEN